MPTEISNCWYKDVCTSRWCTNTCIRFNEMLFLMEHSNIPENRQRPIILKAPDCDYDAFCMLADIKDDMKTFVSSGRNLYITSKYTGNGKTSWAIKLLTKYFDEVWAGNGFRVRGLFIHVPTFLLKLKDFNTHDDALDSVKRALVDVDLVVWDDIASADVSAYDVSQLLMYIDTRMSNGLSNIFTGNVSTRELLQKVLGAKLTSRVWSSNTTVIEFNGGDKR